MPGICGCPTVLQKSARRKEESTRRAAGVPVVTSCGEAKALLVRSTFGLEIVHSPGFTYRLSSNITSLLTAPLACPVGALPFTKAAQLCCYHALLSHDVKTGTVLSRLLPSLERKNFCTDRGDSAQAFSRSKKHTCVTTGLCLISSLAANRVAGCHAPRYEPGATS